MQDSADMDCECQSGVGLPKHGGCGRIGAVKNDQAERNAMKIVTTNEMRGLEKAAVARARRLTPHQGPRQAGRQRCNHNPRQPERSVR